MKVLICPLNWGLGHATRCIPLIRKYLVDGHSVTIAADGNALKFLSAYFPELEFVISKSFQIRYSAGKSQTRILLFQLFNILSGIIREHLWLKRFLKTNHFDLVISDNRFGLWSKNVECVYITHQLMVKMPAGLVFLEPFVYKIHCFIINRYNMCWIPDNKENMGLSGDLAHKYPLPGNAKYIGVLSRFTGNTDFNFQDLDVLAVISGPEPQRTVFEKFIIEKYKKSDLKIVILRGLPGNVSIESPAQNIKLFSHVDDSDFVSYCKSAKKIICRSGYSTIMDLNVLNCLQKAEFYPTPGQTEQEYLYRYLVSKNFNSQN
jgi:hypothetical protein